MSVAGVEPGDHLGGNKEQLVGGALRKLDDPEAMALVTELVDLLQAEGVFDSADQGDIKYVDRLREAFKRIGAVLDEAGSLTWNQRAAPDSADGAPDGGRDAVHPAVRAAAALTPPRRVSPPARGTLSPTGPSLDFTLSTLRRLPDAARPLVGARSHGNASVEVRNEYDAQDFVHLVLRLLYPDVRPEEVVPSYANKSSRIDFLVRDESAAVEVKVTGVNRGERDIRWEIIQDQREYQGHPHVKQLVFVVFDMHDQFLNPVGFERDLGGLHDGLSSHVLIVPWRSAR